MPAGPLEENTLLNDRYRILGVVGRGGMGTVYRAEHIRLDTVVAVKEVRGPQTGVEEHQAALDQCQQEARFLVRLSHPNLPKVTDAFIENDRFYLVMEFIEGITLEAQLREAGGEPLDVGQTVEWGLQIADVLAYLHSQEPPIIFRDLKPANVMIQPEGNVRLIDFGIARRFQPGANRDTALLGSVGYSPPEQFGRHQTDTRSDIYAFGATLHHLLTARDPALAPFKYPPAHILNPAVPPALSQLLDACLAISTEARPAHIHDVALGLLSARDDLAVMPSPPPASGTVAPPPSTASTTGTGGSGSPSGPRIISTKLAEAEAQRRRAHSQEMRRAAQIGITPGKPVSPTGNRATWALIAALLVIAAGSGVAVVISRSRHAPPKAPPLHSNTRSVPPSVVSPRAPIAPPTPAPSLNASAPPVMPPGANQPGDHQPAQNQPVLFTGVRAEGVVADGNGNALLQLVVTGRIRGHRNASGMVAAFFYDESGTPLKATDPQPPYANADGLLSVGNSLQIVEDDQPFAITLGMPLRQFPSEALAGQIKIGVRCTVFVDGQRLRDSDLIMLPPQTFASTNDGSNVNRNSHQDIVGIRVQGIRR